MTWCWLSYESDTFRVKQQRTQNITTSITEPWGRAAHTVPSLVAGLPAQSCHHHRLFPRRQAIPFPPPPFSKPFPGTKAVNRPCWAGISPAQLLPQHQTAWITKINWTSPQTISCQLCNLQSANYSAFTSPGTVFRKSRGRNNRQTNTILNDWSHNWERRWVSQTPAAQNIVSSWTAQKVWQRFMWANVSSCLWGALRGTCTQTDRQQQPSKLSATEMLRVISVRSQKFSSRVLWSWYLYKLRQWMKKPKCELDTPCI